MFPLGLDFIIFFEPYKLPSEKVLLYKIIKNKHNKMLYYIIYFY